MCVTTQLKLENGGANAMSIYIDTEGTFWPERIIEIARWFKLDESNVLEKIFVAKASNTDMQFKLLH